jgi:hypothetical protein
MQSRRRISPPVGATLIVEGLSLGGRRAMPKRQTQQGLKIALATNAERMHAGAAENLKREKQNEFSQFYHYRRIIQ